MRIFDLVGNTHGQPAGARVAVIGSCRVHDPFEALANSGRAVRVWANASSAIHSFGEARQIVRFTLGQTDLPEEFRPFVFHPAEVPLSTAAERRVLGTADVVFVEISDLRQIRHDPFFFQANFFYREFVSKYGAPLLPWYRAFSLGQPISADLVDDAMQKLAISNPVERSMVDAVLRRTWLQTCDVNLATELIGDIMFDRSKVWIFVSHFMVPGVGGAQMKDRSHLIEILKKATAAHGAKMFDPSTLVERLGREVALDADGRDVYHYSPAIHETVADALLNTAGLITDRPLVVGSKADSQNTAVATATEFVNETLIELHQQRVAALGVNESGLYDHYRGLLDRRQLAGEYTAWLANLVVNLLPRFDRYDVLRAGLGEFAFILAALGLRAAAYDQEEKRFGAVVAGVERFKTVHPEMTQLLTVGQVGLPKVPHGCRTLAVAHHLIGYKRQQQDEVLKWLSAYDALLIDPRIFLFSRNTEEEKEEIVEVIRSCGFTRIREYPQIGVVFCQKPND